MSRLQSLLAGSAIAAAMLASSPALAASECGNPSANGSAADFLVCAPGAYAAGIDYSTTSDGDLTVILRDRVDTGTSNTVGTGGIRMFGDVGENMSLLREETPSVAGDPRIINTTGRAVDVTTQGDGNIVVNLTDGDPIGEATTPVATAPAPMRLTGGTDAIRAVASGTGSVNVTIAETGTPNGASHPRAIIAAGAVVGSNGSGVLARSTSGAITIDTRGAAFTINGTNGGAVIDAAATGGSVTIQAGPVAGRTYGVRAATAGTGAIALTLTNGASASGATGIAAIDTTTGTGATVITIASGTVSGGSGAAIRATSASTLAAAVSVQNTVGTVNGRVDFSGVTAGGVTFNNATTGRWTASGASVFGAGADTLTMAGSGDNTTAAGTSLDFGSGADVWNLSGRLTATTTTAEFGAGTDAFNMSGVLAMNGLTLTGLEAFNHSGVIYMGSGSGTASDGVGDDVLRMTGGTFTGSGSARVVMDAVLGLQAQVGCATITAADCLDLRGASTAGVTLLTVNDVNPNGGAFGGYDPVGVTLVDVGGSGTSAADHFVLDPDSPGYLVDPVIGGAIGRPGLFVYALRYDPAGQRHDLVGLPRAEALEYAMLGSAAQSIWQMTSDAVTDRQTNLRDGQDDGSVWVRATGDYIKREVSTDFAGMAFDNSYTLYAGSILGGMDLLVGSAGGYDYALGGQIGYVGSSFDLDASLSTGRFTGGTGGLYGSVWSDWFFLDGALNANVLTLDYDSPGVASKTNTYLNSIGGQAEGGVRVAVSEGAFVEPLVSLSYVRTRFEEISLNGGEVTPADATSMRGALGLRLGATLSGETTNISYFVTGRAWNEFDGETGGVLHNPGADLAFTDDLGGAYGEAELGVNLSNEAGTLSGFLTSGVKFKDGYSATNLSLGMRMAW